MNTLQCSEMEIPIKVQGPMNYKSTLKTTAVHGTKDQRRLLEAESARASDFTRSVIRTCARRASLKFKTSL